MLSLFRWSFNAVGNRIQSSMAGPRATPSKGNYPYLQGGGLIERGIWRAGRNY